MWQIIQMAGWPIYPLLLASIIALGLIIERFLSLRKREIAPNGLLERVLVEYSNQNTHGSIDAEWLAKVRQEAPLGQILAAGLVNIGVSREVMKEAIEDAGRAVAHDLERFLTTLGTIAAMAPLLGLFGTVVGMIEIFGAQSPVSGGNPQQLAHGISVALYNTAFGLVIAIPSMAFYRHFRATVDTHLLEMEKQAICLVDRVHAQQPAWKDATKAIKKT